MGAAQVSDARFIGLGSNPVEIPAPLIEEPPAEVLEKLRELLGQYLSIDQGFTARRMVKTEGFAGAYDQLSRYGEWDGTETAKAETLT